MGMKRNRHQQINLYSIFDCGFCCASVFHERVSFGRQLEWRFVLQFDCIRFGWSSSMVIGFGRQRPLGVNKMPLCIVYCLVIALCTFFSDLPSVRLCMEFGSTCPRSIINWHRSLYMQGVGGKASESNAIKYGSTRLHHPLRVLQSSFPSPWSIYLLLMNAFALDRAWLRPPVVNTSGGDVLSTQFWSVLVLCSGHFHFSTALEILDRRQGRRKGWSVV